MNAQIKATELRIGNLIAISGLDNIARITCISEEGVSANSDNAAHVFEKFCYILPIPLTPEILEKAGFEKISDTEFSIDARMNTFYVLKSPNDLWTIYILTPPTDRYGVAHFPITWTFKYLHFLQNAWPILTGQELPITI